MDGQDAAMDCQTTERPLCQENARFTAGLQDDICSTTPNIHTDQLILRSHRDVRAVEEQLQAYKNIFLCHMDAESTRLPRTSRGVLGVN